LTKPQGGNQSDRRSSRKKVNAPALSLSNTYFGNSGQKIVALVETAQPVCVEKFTEYPQLGRFTLRDEGRTIAIGKVKGLICLSISKEANQYYTDHEAR